jgi:acetyltransferase-like isoleucine patch superfamily enzyme
MKKAALRALRLFLRLFYDGKWLQGKWFENSGAGSLWALRSLTGHLVRRQPWPASKYCVIQNPTRLHIHPSSLNCLQSRGCYFQNQHADIHIGADAYVAFNVGFITQNHDPQNADLHLPGRDVVVGDRCWIGMNSVLLPGVTLGPGTVVGAGSVVTKSFPEGRCVIAGNPAKLLRALGAEGTGAPA